MAVTDDLIALIDAVRPSSLPVARSLIVPPVKTPGQVAGEFCAVALGDGSVGLAYLLLDDTFERLSASPGVAGAFPGDAREFAGWVLDRDPVRRAVGMAAVNAISQHLFRCGGFEPGPDDSLGGLVPSPGEQIGMVGHFPPLVRRFVEAGAALVIVERRRELVGRYDGYEVTDDPRVLARC